MCRSQPLVDGRGEDGCLVADRELVVSRGHGPVPFYAASVPDQRYQEQCMGTWGTGPFDSDLAADFVDGLEGLVPQQTIDVLERAFQRIARSGTHVYGGDGVEAVTAAALVASTIPNSGIVIDPEDGPRSPLPELPASLRTLARQALHRVLQDGSEIATGWVQSAEADQWRQEVQQIIQALGIPADH
jgi:hypothetical protein